MNHHAPVPPNLLAALYESCFSHLRAKTVSPAHAIELRAHEWQQTLTKHQRDESAAAEWIMDAAVLLGRCPASVRQALPPHADNIAAMTDSLSDALGDVMGFYDGKKGEG